MQICKSRVLLDRSAVNAPTWAEAKLSWQGFGIYHDHWSTLLGVVKTALEMYML